MLNFPAYQSGGGGGGGTPISYFREFSAFFLLKKFPYTPDTDRICQQSRAVEVVVVALPFFISDDFWPFFY
jgi:hypothetical protein